MYALPDYALTIALICFVVPSLNAQKALLKLTDLGYFNRLYMSYK